MFLTSFSNTYFYVLFLMFFFNQFQIAHVVVPWPGTTVETPGRQVGSSQTRTAPTAKWCRGGPCFWTVFVHTLDVSGCIVVGCCISYGIFCSLNRQSDLP